MDRMPKKTTVLAAAGLAAILMIAPAGTILAQDEEPLKLVPEEMRGRLLEELNKVHGLRFVETVHPIAPDAEPPGGGHATPRQRNPAEKATDLQA